jgi:hypothetical protein
VKADESHQDHARHTRSRRCHRRWRRGDRECGVQLVLDDAVHHHVDDDDAVHHDHDAVHHDHDSLDGIVVERYSLGQLPGRVVTCVPRSAAAVAVALLA